MTIDIKLDTTANPHVWDWTINGVAQTQKTRADVASDIVNITFRAETVDAWHDDIALSYTAGDYPIASGHVTGTTTESWYGDVAADSSGNSRPGSYLGSPDTGTSIVTGS